MISLLDTKSLGFSNEDYSLFIRIESRRSTPLGFWSIGPNCNYKLDIETGICGHLCRNADGYCCNCAKEYDLCDICIEAMNDKLLIHSI